MGFDARQGWRSIWRTTFEGRTYLSTLRHWAVKLAADGTFRISGVPPGAYDLAISVYAGERNKVDLDDLRARKVVRVTVTAEDAARGEVTLPEIAAPVVPDAGVGDVPALQFERGDGGAGSLADFRGKWTVVHFWTSWSWYSARQIPALRDLQKRYAARNLVLVGLSSDEDPAAWKAALKRLDLPWPQGRIATSGDIGVPGRYWLLDPAGKIFAKGYEVDELEKILEAVNELEKTIERLK